jgi:hypothetical protein
MRYAICFLTCLLTGCPTKGTPSAENKDPYRDVTPQKVKAQVEDAQKKEDDRATKTLEQAR